jgi:hypothetical protein
MGRTAPSHGDRGTSGPTGDFRFRTGDRYLGGQLWERYLGFEEYRASVMAIMLSMIRLGSEELREEVVIRPGLRYAIVMVTNGTMTANKAIWSWTAQEVRSQSLLRCSRIAWVRLESPWRVSDCILNAAVWMVLVKATHRSLCDLKSHHRAC